MKKKKKLLLEGVTIQSRLYCIQAVEIDSNNLKLVKDQNHDVCVAAINRGANSVRHIRDKVKNEKAIIHCMKKNGRCLKHIAMKYRTPEICLEAVRKNPWSLDLLNKEEQTEEICLIGIKKDYRVLKSVKIPQTREMVMASFQYVNLGIHEPDRTLEYVKIKQDRKMVDKALDCNGNNLEFVTIKKDRKMFLTALKDHYHQNQDEDRESALEFIEEKNQDQELCNVAVTYNRYAIKHVSNKFLTRDLVIRSIEGNLYSLAQIAHPLSKETLVEIDLKFGSEIARRVYLIECYENLLKISMKYNCEKKRELK